MQLNHNSLLACYCTIVDTSDENNLRFIYSLVNKDITVMDQNLSRILHYNTENFDPTPSKPELLNFLNSITYSGDINLLDMCKLILPKE